MVSSVDKAIRIIELLCDKNKLGVTEISKTLNIPKSSVHNILKTLEKNKIVEMEEKTSRYLPSFKLLELGYKAHGTIEIYNIARPLIKKLNDELDETVHLTVLDDDEVLYIDCIESKKRLRSYSVVGIKAPLFCTGVGKAILAFLPENEIQRIIKNKALQQYTDNTITDPDLLLKELKTIKSKGYAVDNMEHENYLRCIGAPVFNYASEVLYSISISGPSQRITVARVPKLAAKVKETAESISRLLGFNGRY